jgi:ABC-type nitrate/sulfonate/bicarbonate transport system substrate-binding protein
VQHSIGTTCSFINANQDLVRRLVCCAAEGTDYEGKNRADAIAIISKYTKIIDAAQLQESLATNAPGRERIPTPNQAAIDAVLAVWQTQKQKKPNGISSSTTDLSKN